MFIRLGVTPDGQLNMLESINVSMTPMHPLGMTPSAVAVDKRAAHLYVVCSDANAVAAVDISAARSRVLGFIPTGWYPTAVRVLNDDQLVMLNGKGLGSRANPDGPQPTKPNQPLVRRRTGCRARLRGPHTDGDRCLFARAGR